MFPARTPALLLVLGSAIVLTGAAPPRAPVLVELFTSEGCSSCPPADHLLEQLDPRAIVLSEHVDYWDQEGWKDRFSSHAYTLRQESYSRQLSLRDVYTPEMVVDGAVGFNGSDGRRAADEIAKAAERPKAAVRLTRTPTGVDVNVDDAPHSAAVYLALADNSATSQVGSGENKGRELHHIAVLRSLKKIGSVKHGQAFHKSVALSGDDASRRVVVFVQDSDTGPVIGAAEFQP